jgi:hypothetical protein
MLVQILSGREGVLPHVDARHEVDGVAELGESHVQLVHGRQVLPRLPVALISGPLLRINQFPFLPLLLVHGLAGDLARCMLAEAIMADGRFGPIVDWPTVPVALYYKCLRS